MSSEVKFHPAAQIFPMLEDDKLGELVADIKQNGLREPVVFLDDMIIDGRNRWLACKMAGVKAATKTIETDDPVGYVLSLNLHRRHLTASQRSMVADRARELFDKQAKERQKRKPADSVVANLPQQTARDAAGKALGVSGKLVDAARTVRKRGTPELAKAVDEGRLSVSRAAELATESPDIQKQVAKQATFTKGRYRNSQIKQPREREGEIKQLGVGIYRANEAVNCLKRIPKNDQLRKRGFQIVTDWIRKNK